MKPLGFIKKSMVVAVLAMPRIALWASGLVAGLAVGSPLTRIFDGTAGWLGWSAFLTLSFSSLAFLYADWWCTYVIQKRDELVKELRHTPTLEVLVEKLDHKLGGTWAWSKRLFHFALAVALAALGIWQVSCSNRPSGPTKQLVRIGGAQSYELNLPTLVAIANGYFDKENLDVKDLVVASGSSIRTSLLAKELDFGMLAFVHTPLARAKNQPLKIIMSLHDNEIFSLIVRSGLNDKVKTIADLKGLSVGFTKPGAGSWAFANIYLKEGSLNPDLDVKLVSLGDDVSVIYTALKSGKVDAIISWEPLTTRALDEGIAFPLVQIWLSSEHKKWIGTENALSMTLVTREEVLAQNSDMVRRVVRAHEAGLSYIRSHNTEEIVTLLLGDKNTAKYFDGLSRRLTVQIIDRIKGGFGDGKLNKADYDVEMRLSVESKLVEKNIPFEEAVDSRFVGIRP